MIQYSIFYENSPIREMIQNIDQMSLDQHSAQVIQKTQELVNYTYETNLLSNALLYEVHLYAAIKLLQCQQIKLFYQYMFSAQQYSRHKNTAQSLIYEAFVEPNLAQLQQNYEHNIHLLSKQNILISDTIPSFNSLQYWTLPTDEDNQYYLYDMQEQMLIKRISPLNTDVSTQLVTIDISSDYLYYIDWDITQLLSISNAAKLRNKRVYFIVSDIQKLISSFQGMELSLENLYHVVIFDHVDSFQQHFEQSSDYLPRNINEKTLSKYNLSQLINNLHEKRLNNTSGNHHNILLSIAIPSYNRGHRALANIKHLLQLPYNYEVEFIISNNGSINETKIYYDEIEAINDSRITYFSFDENQGFSHNFIKVCELSLGQYILFLSDEDLIDVQLLPVVLNKLANQKETLAIMKTSTTRQNKWKDAVASKGWEALDQYMLTSNYMSGHIFNRELIQKYKAIEYLKINQTNSVIYWYPHMYLELLLAQYGNVESISMTFVKEGSPEKTEVSHSNIGSNIIIPHYGTIQSRLEQHHGFLKIISQLEISNQNPLYLRMMHHKLCSKTLFLALISIQTYYSQTEHDTKQLVTQVIDACIDKQHYLKYISANHAFYETDTAHFLEHAKGFLAK